MRGEFAENAHHKNFLPSEIDAIRREIEPLEKAAAKQRQREHGGTAPGKHSRKISTSDAGQTRDKVGAFAGVSGRQVKKIAAVVDAAKADPGKYGKLKEDMDQTGRVDGVFRKLKVLRQAETIRKESPPLPNRGPYRVIVVDPPWPYYLRRYDPSNRGACEYPLASVEEICALPVSSIAHEDCILWLWTTNLHLPNAFKVLDAWGFEYKTMLTWAKNHIGTGDWLRGQTEHVLMAVRGKPTVYLTNQTTLLMTPGGRHSEKPAEFFTMVEKLCPAPRYAYLFARRSPGEKWDNHGNQVMKAWDKAAE